MYIEKRKLSRTEISRIETSANIILAVIFIALLFAYWSIQVLRNRYYTDLASQNIIKSVEIKAPRGLILDIHHKRMAENKLNFTLFLNREYCENVQRIINHDCSVLGLKKEDILKKIEKYKNYPSSFMIPIEKCLPLEKVIYIESRSDEFPEFKIEIEPARAYPYGEVGSHILGYISELTLDELNEMKSQDYALGDQGGKSGIEKQYEERLRGTKGVRRAARDNLGRIREIISEEGSIIGETLVLTIDIELQKFVEEIFKEHFGAIGIVDLKTGGLLAMASRPNFNPEFFSGVLDADNWNALVKNPDKPLHNKFLQGIYSPGSTFKVVVALAALQEKEVDATSISLCTGNLKIYDKTFHCWNSAGHGPLDVVDAIKNSCNVYFYRIGKKMDIDVISKYAQMLGLGNYTHIDLPNEKRGLVPTKEWKSHVKKEKWFPGETISVSIGGGSLHITPIQSLQMVSTIALRGRKPKLHFLKSYIDSKGVEHPFTTEFEEVSIEKIHFETVIEGMYKVVNESGTGLAAKVPGLDICGKTGTQQIISKENPNYSKLVKQKKYKPHAWFISFAPRHDPKIAMVVFVEHGGDAGEIAAPLASVIYKRIFMNKQ